MLIANKRETLVTTRWLNINRYPIIIVICLQLVLFPLSLNGQEILQGQVIDTTKSNTPINFVSIGIIGGDVGTITNDSGIFQLLISKDHSNDSLTFSKIGYYPKKIKVADLLIQKGIKIILVPKITQLNEVLITANGTNIKSKGNITRAKWAVMGISSGSLGSELGTVIHFSSNPISVKAFNFHILSNHPDSAKFRFNIYNFDRVVSENVLNENIYFTIPGKYTGDFSVDLSKYHIALSNDVFITVEPVAIFYTKIDSLPNNENNSRILISGTITGSNAFYRKVSLGKWQKVKYSFSPGFWVTFYNN